MDKNLSTKANEIVHHARVFIEAGGYKNFSFADIAEQVNIRKASIHHHFSTKADLVQAVVEVYRQEALEGLASLDQHISDPVSKIQAYLGYWTDCLKEGRSSFCLCAMLAFEMSVLPEAVANGVKQHFQDMTSWLTSLLEEASKNSQLKLQNTPDVEAEAFVANVYGAMLMARSAGDAEVFESLVQSYMKKLMH